MSNIWVVATPNGKILDGPYNSYGNSLQAEGVGMLSVTVFLSLVSKLTVTFLSGNEGLIN